MIIYLNREYVPGPWGGGNKTLKALIEALEKDGHQIVYNLNQQNIDLLFCFDPRPNVYGEWYQDILNYKQFKTGSSGVRPLTLGSNTALGGTTRYFDGWLDEARVYNKSLNAKEEVPKSTS